MKACYIIGALPSDDIFINKSGNPLIIAADGGLTQLDKINIVPDIVVGDFDSLNFEPAHPFVIKLPREKDDTDIYRAAIEGLLRGCDCFFIFGGLGGRLDHTFANIQILKHLSEKNARGFLFGDGFAATVIRSSSFALPAKKEGVISVFSLSDVSEGVTLEGLYYPLRDATITSSYPVGISNEFVETPAQISVKSGTLLILWNEKAENVINYVK